MAQNITLMNASYSAVPAVTLPKTGGGTATFTDTSDANATASDIASGKTAYVNGEKITGTGGGGGTTWETVYQDNVVIEDWGEEWKYVWVADYFQTHDYFVVGDTYRVTWQSVPYVTQAVNGDIGGSGAVIGDASTTFASIPFAGQAFWTDDLVFATNVAYGQFQLKIEHQIPAGGSTLITKTITANGTYDAEDDDADGYSSVTVAVPGSWTLLATQEYTVNTTNTSNASVGNININLSDAQNKDIIIVVHIRDKAGKRSGYFYGSDAFFLNYVAANNGTGYISTKPYAIYNCNNQGNYGSASSTYGIYARYLYQTSSDHYVQIYSRYSSGYGTINGTYKVDIYKLTPPTGMTLFN